MIDRFSPLYVNPSLSAVAENTSRFSSAAWFDKVRYTSVTIAGCGGIGSWTALMISRMHPASICLIDPDTVDMSNMGGQLFSSDTVGVNKVEAIAQQIRSYSAFHALSSNRARVEEIDASLGKVVICGFDNMEARRTAYYAWKTRIDPDIADEFLLIDGRLSAEQFQVFCIPGTETFYMNEYESKWLFSDAEAESVVCSYKQTSYCANMIASVICNLFTNWVANQCEPIVDRSLPFMTEYDAEQMFFKTVV